MAERRTLTEGLKATPRIDPAVAKEFILSGKGPAAVRPAEAPPAATPAPMTNRAPISTRIRADMAAALKRASLERQLKGIEPNTLQDILEEAIEPWLKANGYLS
jgi:hypothetical protein